MIITCDGPAASGKSTIGKLVAQRLQIAFLSSGWFYRALAYLLLTYERYTLDTIYNADLEHISYYLDPALLHYEYTDNKATLYFKNEDITSYLKDYTIDRGSILLSPIRSVRDKIMLLQRKFAENKSCVVEGRDCGSIVFPYADYKFFITADNVVRAARWKKDQEKKGYIFTQEQAEKLLADRDERDRNRIFGALVIPEGAYIVDTTALSLEEAVDLIVVLVHTGIWKS